MTDPLCSTLHEGKQRFLELVADIRPDLQLVGVFRARSHSRLDYFVELTTRDGAITLIKDFRYVPYIAADAAIELA